MTGEPVTTRLRGDSLLDRLAIARDRIQQNRGNTASAEADRQPLWNSRTANAIEKLDSVVALLEPVVESLTAIGLDAELNEPVHKLPTDSVVWGGYRSLTFQSGQTTLYVQARIDAGAVNEINWMVSLTRTASTEDSIDTSLGMVRGQRVRAWWFEPAN